MKRKAAAPASTTGADGAAAKKARATRFDAAAVAARGFATHGPPDALPRALVAAVVRRGAAAGGAAGAATLPHEVIAEKDLPGAAARSRRVVHCLGGGESGPPRRLVVFYTGRRFVKKDREQTVALLEAVRQHRPELRDAPAVVLLDEAAGICRRNALYHLIEAGVVVQRV